MTIHILHHQADQIRALRLKKMLEDETYAVSLSYPVEQAQNAPQKVPRADAIAVLASARIERQSPLGQQIQQLQAAQQAVFWCPLGTNTLSQPKDAKLISFQVFRVGAMQLVDALMELEYQLQYGQAEQAKPANAPKPAQAAPSFVDAVAAVTNTQPTPATQTPPVLSAAEERLASLFSFLANAKKVNKYDMKQPANYQTTETYLKKATQHARNPAQIKNLYQEIIHGPLRNNTFIQEMVVPVLSMLVEEFGQEHIETARAARIKEEATAQKKPQKAAAQAATSSSTEPLAAHLIAINELFEQDKTSLAVQLVYQGVEEEGAFVMADALGYYFKIGIYLLNHLIARDLSNSPPLKLAVQKLYHYLEQEDDIIPETKENGILGYADDIYLINNTIYRCIEAGIMEEISEINWEIIQRADQILLALLPDEAKYLLDVYLTNLIEELQLQKPDYVPQLKQAANLVASMAGMYLLGQVLSGGGGYSGGGSSISNQNIIDNCMPMPDWG